MTDSISFTQPLNNETLEVNYLGAQLRLKDVTTYSQEGLTNLINQMFFSLAEYPDNQHVFVVSRIPYEGNILGGIKLANNMLALQEALLVMVNASEVVITYQPYSACITIPFGQYSNDLFGEIREAITQSFIDLERSRLVSHGLRRYPSSETIRTDTNYILVELKQ